MDFLIINYVCATPPSKPDTHIRDTHIVQMFNLQIAMICCISLTYKEYVQLQASSPVFAVATRITLYVFNALLVC